MLGDTQAGSVRQKLIEKPLDNRCLLLAHRENYRFARMRLRTFFFNMKILVDKQFKAILRFSRSAPVAEGDIFIFPGCAFKSQAGFGDINLVVGKIAFTDSIA